MTKSKNKFKIGDKVMYAKSSRFRDVFEVMAYTEGGQVIIKRGRQVPHYADEKHLRPA